jgi:tRNA(fMet)-specific endonuclease VapC
VIVADTDVLIDYLRGAGAADRVAFELGTGRLATTAITAFELWSGAHGKRQTSAVALLLDALDILPLTAACADRAAEVHRSLAASGSTIGMADSLIAGICLEGSAILMTRNRKHFARVKGLALATLT